jgi:hypothetical protein
MDIRRIIREEVANVFDSPKSTVDTPDFKNWFGDSEMIDREGNPIVFYHGSKSDFETFDKNKIGSSTDPGWLGEGFYFYDNPHDAAQYGKVKSYYLKIENPYFATDEENERLAELNNQEASREFSEDLKTSRL